MQGGVRSCHRVPGFWRRPAVCAPLSHADTAAATAPSRSGAAVSRTSSTHAIKSVAVATMSRAVASSYGPRSFMS